MYYPILKWKKGELIAFEKLNETLKSKCIPIFELYDEVDIKKLITDYGKHLQNPFFFKNTLSEDNLETTKLISKEFTKNSIWGFPVIDIDNINYINNLPVESAININFPINISDDLNIIYQKIVNNPFKFIILNLGEVKTDDPLTTLKLTQALGFIKLFDPSDKYKIIVASTSFPQALDFLLSNSFVLSERVEEKIFKELNSLVNKKIFFSDFGVTKGTSEEIPAYMFSKILPKVRYTLSNSYYISKGQNESIPKSKKRVGYKELAYNLVNSDYFLGEDFSYGSSKIFEISQQNNEKKGSNTNWVTYSVNHHLTFVLKSLSTLYDF